MEIYIDVLFLENILINYLILIIAGRFSGKRTSAIRLLSGSIIGAAYVAFMVLCPNLKTFYTVTAKILLAFFITAVSFKSLNLKDFLRNLGALYITTLIFAGVGYAIINLTEQGNIVKNGVIWFESPIKVEWTVIAMTAAVGILLLRAFLDLFKKKVYRDSFTVTVKIIVENKEVSLPALVDTGNALCEPLSHMPVVIVEMDALKDVVPKWIVDWDFLKSYSNKKYNEETDIKWRKRFRIIPFNSIGKENGLLPGFKPDSIQVEDENGIRSINEVIIGVYNTALFQDSYYKAIIGPEIYMLS